MNNILYHGSEPQNVRGSYTENEQVEFLLDFPNRALIKGSVCLSGEVTYTNGFVALDGMAGAHSFINSIQVSFVDNGGILEDITFYNNLHRSHVEATTNYRELFNATNVCEMKFPDDNINLVTSMTHGARNIKADQNLFNLTKGADFSVKLDCMLNNILNSEYLNYSKSGKIKISIRLARNEEALRITQYPLLIDKQANYILSNLRIDYISALEQTMPSQLQFKTWQVVKSTVENSLTTINARVSNPIRAISVKFQEQSTSNNFDHNEFLSTRLPNLNGVQFLVNDTTNNRFNYTLENTSEILENYRLSWIPKSVNNLLTYSRQKNGDGFGVGLDMGMYVPTVDDKIQLQLQCDILPDEKYNAYLFFNTLTVF